MSGERDNDMVDEELVQPGVGGEVGSTKVSPAPDSTATTGEKTMESDAGSTKTTSRFPLFLVLVSSIVLLVATGAFYDWNIIVSLSTTLLRGLYFLLSPSSVFSSHMYSTPSIGNVNAGRKLVASLDTPSRSRSSAWPYLFSASSSPRSAESSPSLAII